MLQDLAQTCSLQAVEVNGYKYSYLHAVEGTGKPTQKSNGSWVLPAPFTWGCPATSCAEQYQQTADLLLCTAAFGLQIDKLFCKSVRARGTAQCPCSCQGWQVSESCTWSQLRSHCHNVSKGLQVAVNQRNKAAGHGLTPAVILVPSCFYLPASCRM